MIRQTIAESRFNNLTVKEHKFFIDKTRHQRYNRNLSLCGKDITIGVLQGLLLDAGYSIELDSYEDGDVFVNIDNTREKYTKEPIDVLLEAVLTLVIGD